jgi:hypothetical protein
MEIFGQKEIFLTKQGKYCPKKDSFHLFSKTVCRHLSLAKLFLESNIEEGAHDSGSAKADDCSAHGQQSVF